MSLIFPSLSILSSNCGAALAASQAALGAWLKLPSSVEMPYVANATQCPAEDRTRAQALLGDSSGSKTQVMASSTQYSKESRSTVTRLAEHTVALNNYNAEYLANKTQALRVSALEMVMEVNGLETGSMNASFGSLRNHVSSLVACVTPAGGGSTNACTALARSARQRLEGIVTDWQGLFDEAAQGFEAYKHNWYDVRARSEAAYSGFVSFYNDVRDGIQRAGLSTKDFGNAFKDVDFDVMFVNPGELLDGMGILTDVPPVPTLDGVWTAVRPAVDLFLQNLTMASLETNLRAVQWALALESSLTSWNVTPDDYRPPLFMGSDGIPTSVEAAVAAHDSLADAFVARTATSLETFDSYNDYVGSLTAGATNVSRSNVTTLMDNLPRFDFNFKLKYESFAPPDFDMDAFLRMFDSIPELALVTDTIYRVYSSMRIFWRFKTQFTALKLPTVDLRPDFLLARRASIGWSMLQRLHPRRLLAWLLASPYLARVLLCAFLFPLLVYAIAMYIAVYRDYQQGCVFRTDGAASSSSSATPARNSYATKTLNSLAFNAAAYQGNQAMFDGLKVYNQRRAQYCADYGKAAQMSQRNAVRYLTTLRSSQSETQGKVHLLASCLDIPALDAAFVESCCETYSNGTAAAPIDTTSAPFSYAACEDDSNTNRSSSCPINANYAPARPYPPLSLSLGTSACQSVLVPSENSTQGLAIGSPWALKDGVFHCEVLPSCTPTCSGPHPELLQVWSRHCACSSEWTLHAYILAGSFVVLTYVVLNMARKMLMQGLSQTHWRLLSDGKLTFLGHCDEDGRLLFGFQAAPTAGEKTKGIDKVTAVGEAGDKATVEVDNPTLRTAAPPAASSPRGQAAVAQESDEGPGDDVAAQEQAARRAFIHGKVAPVMRAYERQGRVMTVLAVVLVVTGIVLLTKAPQYLQYHP